LAAGGLGGVGVAAFAVDCGAAGVR
jgi:hypothetical protein